MRNRLTFDALVIRLSRSVCYMALAVFVITVAQSQQSIKGIMPVTPELLFTVLPKEVKGWKLKQSKGRLDVGIWLESEVLREFERDRQEKGGKQGVPAAIKLTLTDTAKAKGGELDLFDNFRPEKFPEEGYEYLYLGGVPAILIRYENKEVEAKFLIKERFILKIVTRGQSAKNLKNWFDKMQFSVLLAIPDQPEISLPDEFTVIEIDELNPSKSRRYSSCKSLQESLGEENEGSNLDLNINK